MSTIYTVTATLSYALRNPDCTTTSRDELMRMAARYIDELEKANYDLRDEVAQLDRLGMELGEQLGKYKTGQMPCSRCESAISN